MCTKFNLAIGVKTIWHAYPTFKKSIDCVQKIEREFLFVEGIQEVEFDVIKSFDAVAGNDQTRPQRSATITCFTCSHKGHYRKDCLDSAGTRPFPNQLSSMQT